MGEPISWDLYRTFEAVVRLGSLTAAARALGVSQSTVSRHLAALEANAGSPLLLREGKARPTERGDALLAAVKPMIDAARGVRAALDASPSLHGEVTIATVGELARWLLAPALPELWRAYPALRLRVLADNRVASLAAGEADVALRVARPARGELVARRLHALAYGLYASTQLPLHAESPWLGLCGSLARVPEQQWIERAFAPRAPRLLIEDVEALARAVAGGLGVAVLPRSLAGRVDGLVEIAAAQVGGRELGPIPARELWIVVHRSRQRVPKVRAVLRWLESLRAP